MKLLTATTETQAQHPDDFAWCVPGELVTPTGSYLWETDPDGGCGCGCRRSFTGLSSHKATTTAVVTDLDGFGFEDLVTAVRGYRESAGWPELGDDPGDITDARHEALIITEIAAAFEVGDILRIHDGAVNLCGSGCRPGTPAWPGTATSPRNGPGSQTTTPPSARPMTTPDRPVAPGD